MPTAITENGVIDTHVDNLFDTYGPCARTILNLYRHPEDEHLQLNLVADATSHIAHGGIALLNSLHTLNFPSTLNQTPSSLIFVRPFSKENRSQTKLFIPTLFLEKKLALAIAEVDNAQLQTVFSWMSGHSLTRTAAGWMFENFVHAWLTSKGNKIAVFNEDDHSTFIQTTTHSIPGTLDALRAHFANPPLYWRPSQNNFPGIDAVLCTGSEIWAIQATIAYKHSSAEQGLQKLLQTLGNSVIGQLRLLVVGNNTGNAQVVLKNMKPWKQIPIYYCNLDVGLFSKDTTKAHLQQTINQVCP
jgi:hypothetical protein